MQLAITNEFQVPLTCTDVLAVGRPTRFFNSPEVYCCSLSKQAYMKAHPHCGLVVRVPGYRSGGPGSIPDTIRKN
jgi:hypothetical protein